jgi:hypothetical protein
LQGGVGEKKGSRPAYSVWDWTEDVHAVKEGEEKKRPAEGGLVRSLDVRGSLFGEVMPIRAQFV